jgi:hypothetical protein
LPCQAKDFKLCLKSNKNFNLWYCWSSKAFGRPNFRIWIEHSENWLDCSGAFACRASSVNRTLPAPHFWSLCAPGYFSRGECGERTGYFSDELFGLSRLKGRWTCGP